MSRPDGTVEDEAAYEHLPPWPTSAVRQGDSLHRQTTVTSGQAVGAWRPDQPSPGTAELAPIIEGDFDGSGDRDEADIRLMAAALRSPTPASQFDLNHDGAFTPADRDRLILDLFDTVYGDADLNGVFDFSDLVLVLQHGTYEDDQVGNAIWSDGDWNGDGEFDSADFVLAFQTGLYEIESQAVGNPLAAAVDWPLAQNQRASRPRAYVA